METVLITGASSGIGRELAKLFAADAADLYLVARSESELEELAAELRQQYGTVAVVLPFDLAQYESGPKLVQALADRGLEVDVLVNCAGFGLLGEFVSLDSDQQRAMIQLNVTTLTELTRRLLPAMINKHCGGVLNVSSVAAYQAGPNMAVYYATKAYVTSFTEAIREEVADSGVHVCCLAPGATKTEFGDRSGMGALDMFKKNAMSAEAVAKSGYRGFRRNHATVIPGWTNKLIVLAAKLFPRTLTRKVVARIQQPSESSKADSSGSNAAAA